MNECPQLEMVCQLLPFSLSEEPLRFLWFVCLFVSFLSLILLYQVVTKVWDIKKKKKDSTAESEGEMTSMIPFSIQILKELNISLSCLK